MFAPLNRDTPSRFVNKLLLRSNTKNATRPLSILSGRDDNKLEPMCNAASFVRPLNVQLSMLVPFIVAIFEMSVAICRFDSLVYILASSDLHKVGREPKTHTF